MFSRFACLVVACVGWACTGWVGAQPDLPSGRGLPKDAAAFVKRTGQCNHWGSEEVTSAARRQEIRKALRRLKCSRLEADERALRNKYHDAPTVLDAIEEAKALS